MKGEILLVCGIQYTKSDRSLGLATFGWEWERMELNWKPGRFSQILLIQTWHNMGGKSAESKRIGNRENYGDTENMSGDKT